MNKIKKTLLYLLGFAALLLIITVVINLPAFDEELLPEVAAIKNIQAEPFSENNAYPALIAINSDSGSSLKAATKTVRDHLNQQITDTGIDFLTNETQNEIAGGDDSSWKNAYHQCRSRTDKGCMTTLINDMLTSPINDSRLVSQLQRYEDLIEYTEFQGATQMSFDSPLIPLGSTLALKRLYLAEAYINQSSDDYLSTWQKDSKFWRMVLAESHLLITRMVAIATVSTSIDSLSTTIKQGALSPNQLKQIQADIKTLNNSEIDLGRTFEFEFKYGMSMVGSEEAESPIGLTEWDNFFQPQATHNFNYLHITKPLKKVAALNTAEFYQYLESDQPAEDFASPVKWSPSMLYNPVGKILVGYAIPAYTDYIARVHDLNGMFYLLKLQIEIALNPDRAVEQVITNSQYTSPYTLKPMAYNSESHSIYFECKDKTSSCELDL